MQAKLKALFQNHFNEPVETVMDMPPHGSNRYLIRLQGKSRTAIGVGNRDREENEAFLAFSRHFKTKGLPVPEIYAQDLDNDIYLEEDLGNTTLFDALVTQRGGRSEFPEKMVHPYERVVAMLPRFQVEGAKGLDWSVCYPRHRFDRQSMFWDLNYFKYYFLKLAHVPFNEQRLEDDFNTLVEFLLEAPQEYFLYRDFQSRNIMLKDGEPWFIDYQGGRKGALQYDIASLLYDAKANIPEAVRAHLLEKYLDALSQQISVDRTKFTQYFHGYVFIRLMQAMGAYGYRGFYERKEHFLQSVPYAIQNLENLLKTVDLPVEIPTLMEVFHTLVRSSALREFGSAKLKLTVRVMSFAYKNGVPTDERGHGGGFVFDCRYLPNPGREIAYKMLTGKDADVKRFFRGKPAVSHFLENVYAMVDAAVESYQKQNFTDLMVCFGCTGGQHRSVYAAEALAHHLETRFKKDMAIQIEHRNEQNWPGTEEG